MHAVLDLVAARGVDAVSAQLVADAVGITQPAVFRHFPTMEALWLAVMDWLEVQLGEVYRAAGERPGEPALLGLGRMFLGHIQLIARRPALAKLVFADHLRLQYPSLQRRFARLHQGYRARLIEIIARAKDSQEVDKALPPETAVTMFLCMVQGLAFQLAIARFPLKPMRDAERIFALYLRAIGS